MSDINENVNLNNLFDQFENRVSVDYKNPMEAPYGNEDRNTRSQTLAWDFLKERTGESPVIAMIGAKGSAKTHFGSAFAFHIGQTYPGSMGCCISNTYSQAKDNAGALFAKMARTLDYDFDFFTKKKLNGRPYTSVFVADLDGTGMNKGKRFYMLVRSFDAVQKLEGIELDWLWIEELQDAEKQDFATVVSRVRGQNADQSIFIAGMPHDEFHWMYSMIPRLGAKPENNVREELGYEPFTISELRKQIDTSDEDALIESLNRVDVPQENLPLHEADVRGIMFEPTVFENKDNIPDSTIPRLFTIYDGQMAERYVFGQRSSLLGNKILHEYSDHLHRTGLMSKVLCQYDRHLPIILSIDFNTSPMSATLWQKKQWNDKWDDAFINRNTGKFEVWKDGRDKIDVYDNLEDYAAPNREIIAQIDEFEVWQGGTSGLMKEFKKRYVNKEVEKHPGLAVYDFEKRRVCHHNGITILGDATGNRLYTSADKTDWQIVRRHVRDIPSVSTIPGLVTNSNYNSGEVKYSNPARRATINNLNASLKDAANRVWLCFMPTSRYKSGGAARSCALMTKTGDGKVDASNDKEDAANREVARTHFFDTVRYLAWWFRGTESGITPEEFEGIAANLTNQTRTNGSTFGDRRFGNDWTGV